MMGIYAIMEKKEGCAMTDKFNEHLEYSQKAVSAFQNPFQ
jgi:hypothetical protein